MEEYNDVQTMGMKPPKDCQQGECTKTAYQYAEVSVPIEIEPEVFLGDLETECCGEPTVICRKSGCCDKCEITVIQKLCIKIPITYKVKACKSEGSICCEMEEICCN